ncbi:hypothetical protein GF354_05655 [Candidatus Peregrinibacteria bacterium]|nr:hypothetical protein [Candidatus Peregrinibacteria bacterium]
MGQETIKLELIEWLTKLADNETIEYLKIVKDSRSKSNDWWDDLTEAQKQGIAKGLKDIEQGKTFPHDEIKNRYGL